MTGQTSLFLDEDSLVPYRPFVDQDTSQQAAASYSKPKAQTLRDRIFALIQAQPLTDYEIQKLTGEEGNTVRPRRRELVMRELITDSGDRRPTPSGRKAIVWRAV